MKIEFAHLFFRTSSLNAAYTLIALLIIMFITTSSVKTIIIVDIITSILITYYFCRFNYDKKSWNKAKMIVALSPTAATLFCCMILIASLVSTLVLRYLLLHFDTVAHTMEIINGS